MPLSRLRFFLALILVSKQGNFGGLLGVAIFGLSILQTANCFSVQSAIFNSMFWSKSSVCTIDKHFPGDNPFLRWVRSCDFMFTLVSLSKASYQPTETFGILKSHRPDDVTKMC